MEISHTILDAIGNTPLLDMGDGILAKCEYLNPSGSIKARMAKYLIERAEQEGLLKPGDTIVESTSGNTGNAMSLMAAVKGYKMLVLMPNGYSTERIQISQGLGAYVEFIGHFQVNEALERSYELGEKDGFYCPRQFDNEWNVEGNRESLGMEILSQIPSDVKIDAIVQGVGTGGTIVGVTQALRRHHNPDLKAFVMEPSESRIIACGEVAEHKIEGIADGFIPELFKRHENEIDGYIDVPGDEAFLEAKTLARTKGLFVGPSSGANYYAAKKLKALDPSLKTVLTFLCDKGEKYLSLMW